MTKALWCPFATKRTTKNMGYYDPAGRPIPLTPRAVFVHSTDGPPMAPPPQSMFDGKTNSSTFWVYGDGALDQLVPLDTPAWANGLLNNPNGHNSPNALVREWFTRNRNPNLDTISVEVAGYGQSRGHLSEPMSPPQRNTLHRLFAWLEREDHIQLSLDVIMLHSWVSRTLCPDGRWTPATLWAAYVAWVEGRAVFPELQPGNATAADISHLWKAHTSLNGAVLARFQALAEIGDILQESGARMKVAVETGDQHSAINALVEGFVMLSAQLDRVADPAQVPGRAP